MVSGRYIAAASSISSHLQSLRRRHSEWRVVRALCGSAHPTHYMRLPLAILPLLFPLNGANNDRGDRT